MNELLELIEQAINEENYKEKLKKIFNDYHPYDIASIFEKLDDQSRQAFYESLSEEELADIFEYLDEEKAAIYITEMSYAQGANVLNEMEVDDAVDVLNELDEDDVADKYLEHMASNDAAELNYLKDLAEDTAGAIMTTNFISFKSGIDVKDAMRQLGYQADKSEIIDPLFVCDENNKLLGVLSLKDLIIARTPNKVDAVMNTNFIYGNIDEDKISITNKISNYDLYALPILKDGILEGIVTMDDALDVASEDISEDYAKLSAVDVESEAELPIWKNILKRLPWLLVLLIISLLVSNLTEKFEDIIKSITILWFFNTMILDMAGNAGTQSLAVSVRHIGRNDIEKGKDAIKYILREFLVTCVNALILGIVSFVVTSLFIIILKYNDKVSILWTALVISGSLTITLMVTGLLGTLIPMFMHKIKIDPAVASGPLITTLNDIVAMLIYFGLAYMLYDKIVMAI